MNSIIKVAMSVVIGAALPNLTFSQGTAVETFSCTATTTVAVPGSPAGSGLVFNLGHVFTSGSWAPGSVMFQGQPVDLDGTEMTFFANTYVGTFQVPVTSGPDTVDASSYFSMSGTTNWTATISLSGVQLHSAFSASAPILLPGSIPFTTTASVWNSAVVPALNGAYVSFSGTINIIDVDPLHNQITTFTTGTLWASPAASSTWYCGTGVNVATDGFVVTAPPILGGTMGASVTGCASGSTGAILVAYATPFTSSHRWGEILVNFADPNGELFGMPIVMGNPAHFSLPVPSDLIYSGIAIYTQAASFGGGVCLHCAYECTLGL